MEHLVIRVQGGLPYRLESLNDCSMSFQIPKTKRLKTRALRSPSAHCQKGQVILGSDWHFTPIEAKRSSEQLPHLLEWVKESLGSGMN